VGYIELQCIALGFTKVTGTGAEGHRLGTKHRVEPVETRFSEKRKFGLLRSAHMLFLNETITSAR